MVRRTVMRVGDRSAFAGTATQIVDWDLRKESQPHVNGIERGFLVAPPLPSMKYSPIAPKIDILSANRSLYIVDESMLDSFLSKCSWLFKGQALPHYPYPSNFIDPHQYVDTYNPNESGYFMRKDLVQLKPGILLDIILRASGKQAYSSGNSPDCSITPAPSSRLALLYSVGANKLGKTCSLIPLGGLESKTLERRILWQIHNASRRNDEEAFTRTVEISLIH